MMSHFGALNSSFESLIEEWLILISEIWYSDIIISHLGIFYIWISCSYPIRIWDCCPVGYGIFWSRKGDIPKRNRIEHPLEGKITLPELSVRVVLLVSDFACPCISFGGATSLCSPARVVPKIKKRTYSLLFLTNNRLVKMNKLRT